ncbi:MAG: hypothetical protein PUB04_09290 [Clostridia bacterium]|nr:hypothetical protein [Clostridia bacterium]
MMFRNKNSKTYIEKHDEMLFEERMTYEYSCSEVIGLYFDASDAWENLPDRDRKEYRDFKHFQRCIRMYALADIAGAILGIGIILVIYYFLLKNGILKPLSI